MECLEKAWCAFCKIHTFKRKWLKVSYDMANIRNMGEESRACAY